MSARCQELVERLSAPRAVWVMVPAGEATRATVEQPRARSLDPGDVVVDGGNSHYKDDQEHAKLLAEKGIGFVDAGVSGGVWGLQNGYALMVGGAEDHVKHLMPIFEALKPEGEFGFVHSGEVGAGHFAKMVHNGIEYGMMQAYAEGWELLEASDLVKNVPGDLPQLARGHGHPVLAAGPGRPGAGRRSRPRQAQGLCTGLRRGPVDGAGGDRHGGALPVITAALFAQVRLAAGRLAGDEDGRGAAQPVRRARGGDARRAPTRRAPT